MAAADAEHAHAEKAKTIWFDRFGHTCPVELLAGVPVELLVGPPSERFLAQLTVLRGASGPARNTMVDVLLAEAPERASPPDELTAGQREALALLLYTLRNAGRLYKHPTRSHGEDEWAKLLYARFGSPAIDGLLTIAEPAAILGVDHGWLPAVSQLVRAGAFSEAQRERLRGIARAAFLSPHWDGATAPLLALLHAGPPLDLADRLLAIATAPDQGEDDPHGYARIWAADTLVAMAEAPTFDAEVTSLASEALAARDWARFARLIRIAAERGSPPAVALAERAVDAYDGDLAAFDAMLTAGHVLVKRGHIDEAWLAARLRDPEAPLFSLAAALVPRPAPPALVTALFAALDSPARDHTSAAEAAEALIRHKALEPTDPRVLPLIDRAPEPARAGLVEMLLLREVPVASYRRHLVDLLLSTDATLAADIAESAYLEDSPDIREVFEEVLLRGPSARVKETIEITLGKEGEAARYWQDGVDEEEDGEVDAAAEDGEAAD
ncbi:MAG: hypothetical protein QM820_28545 [Minicystis sp.]